MDKLPKRLRELADAVAERRMDEFTMRVPVDPDRDADIVLSKAADQIERLQRIKVEAEHVLDAYEEGRQGEDFDTILHQMRIALRGEAHASECINPSGSTGDGRTNWDRPKAALRGEADKELLDVPAFLRKGTD